MLYECRDYIKFLERRRVKFTDHQLQIIRDFERCLLFDDEDMQNYTNHERKGAAFDRRECLKGNIWSNKNMLD